MTDFDSILAARLGRLDAAMPDPRPVSVATPTQPRTRRPMRLMLLAAAVGLLGLAAGGALGSLASDNPATIAANQALELRVSDDLGAQLAGKCLTSAQAQRLVRDRLDALGLADWKVRVDGRIARSPCVGGAAIGDTHEVLLSPSMGARIGAAVDAVDHQLLTKCLGRDDARALLVSSLIAAGAIEPHVEMGGVTQVPVDDREAFLAHVKAGCIVYGGAQFDQEGLYTWHLSGQ